MKYNIPKEVVEKSAACDKHLKCLTSASHELCPVRFRSVNEAVTFIECATNKDCPFLETFTSPDMAICNCPVRKEIFQRYKV
jgi:hypothetical protein